MKEYLKHRCPYCGGQMFVTKKGYRCSDCEFFVPGYICNRHISKEDAEKILSGSRVILDGFATNAGKAFTSVPIICDHTIRLEQNIACCHHPHGANGMISVNRLFFYCTNSKCCKTACRFAKDVPLRRTIDGHMITFEEITDLLISGVTLFNTFSDNGEVGFQMIANPAGGGYFDVVTGNQPSHSLTDQPCVTHTV